MSTVLTPLSPGLYTPGTGALFFFPFTDPDDPESYAEGYHLGDLDDFSINVEITKGERKSNNYSTAQKVKTWVTEISVTGSATLVQLSDLVRAISMSGNVEKFSQAAATAEVLTIEAGKKGVYSTGKFGISNVTATLGVAETPMVKGVDFKVDAGSGLIELIADNTEEVNITYDAMEITDRFMTGIASSDGMYGLLKFIGVNDQGVKPCVGLYSTVIRNSGGRSFISPDNPGTISVEFDAFPHPDKESPFEFGYETTL